MSAYKIALSPEDRESNTYHPAALYEGRPTNERQQMRRLADLLEAHLKRCGFAVQNLQGPSMRERVARANAWGADLYIAPHTNGFDGTASGTRVHCYPSEKSRRIGRLLQDRIAPLSPGKGDKLVESTGLYELRATKMPAVLPEYGFHDNEAEAKWLVEHIPLLAAETARAVCDYFALPYVEDSGGPAVTPGGPDGGTSAPDGPAVTWELRRLENGAVVQTWTLVGCE